jgi:hypothetical protein
MLLAPLISEKMALIFVFFDLSLALNHFLTTVKAFALNHVLLILQTMVLMFVLTALAHRLVSMDLFFSMENARYQLKMFYQKLFKQLNAIHFA